MAAIALGLVTAAAASYPSRPAPERSADTISLIVGSWGRQTYQWVIRADGSGEVRTLAGEGSDFNDYSMLVRPFQSGPEAFERVRALLQIAESYVGTGRDLDCVVRGTDGPQGRLMWSQAGRGWVLNIIYACQSEEADRVYDAVRAADALVSAQVEGRPGETHRQQELPDIHSATIAP